MAELPFFVASSRGVDHLFDHLSLREALGETPKGVGLDVGHGVGVGVHRLVYAGVAPEERSLARVVSELGKSRALIDRWSANWSWLERARIWDGYQELRRLEKQIEEKQRMDDEHLKIVRGARDRAIPALAQTKVEDLANNPRELRNSITELIKFERLIMGEPEIIEVRSEKIQAQATIEEHLKPYATFFQELLDEGAIRLNGHHDQLKRENGKDEAFNHDEPDDE